MQSYVVRKLADGNCWMAENLQLNLSTSHSYKVGTFDGGEADWTPNQTTSDNSYNYAITADSTSDVAVIDYRNIQHNNWSYTWHAAVAANSDTRSIYSYTSTQSICPKGWRLPPYSNNKSFYNLITTKYGLSTGSAINNDPLNFYPTKNSSSTNAYAGFYWSASEKDNDNAFSMTLTDNYVSSNYSLKYATYSVRCVSLQ